MKFILSRKGYDSQYGGEPSPVLADGTMLSLPIPDAEIIPQLAANFERILADRC